MLEFLEWASRNLAPGMLAGLVAGLVVGGVGSRLGMRVMALTSPQAIGLETEFGARVGEITAGGTVFLLIAGGILGMAGGIVYRAVRALLPGSGWVRGLVFGTILLALAGPLLVSPSNRDFFILSPAGLAVAMFAALPVLYGLAFVPLSVRVEPLLRRVRTPVLVTVPVVAALVPLVLAGGLGLLVIAGALLAWGVRDRIGTREKRALRLAGLFVLGALVVWRGAAFVGAVAEVLRSTG